MNEYTGWVVAGIMALVAIRYIYKYTKLEQMVLNMETKEIIKALRKELKNSVKSAVEEEIEEGLRGDTISKMPDSTTPKSGVAEEDDEAWGDGQCPKTILLHRPEHMRPMTPDYLKDKWFKFFGWKK